MGDRGNIAIEQGGTDGRVYLYTHWSGYRTPRTLSEALSSPAGRNRWSDGPYLGRIIFDALTAKARDPESGFEISTFLCDNEYPILVVDPDARTVKVEIEPGRSDSRDVGGKRWSFEQFIALGLGETEEPWDVLAAAEGRS